MTEEQKAEKYAHEHYIRQHGSIAYRKSVEDVWLDGYHEGFKDCAKARLNVTTISDCPIKDDWHDLEKDPTDLPKEEKQYVVKAKDLDGDITVWICWYWTETKTFTGSYLGEMNVIKWKEIE